MQALSALLRPTGMVAPRRMERRVALRPQAVFRLISRPDVGQDTLGGAASHSARLRQLNTMADVSSPVTASAEDVSATGKTTFHGVHHVALICNNLERSLEFYQGVLGLEVNPDRPHDKLPYRGAWLWIGPEMIHLMELPNPDPSDKAKRPEHGGRDRHFCIGVANVDKLAATLEAASIPFTRSMSGRPAIFFRDPDANTLECVELEPWR